MDTILAVLLAVAALIESHQPDRQYNHPAVLIPAALLTTLPLAWRRRAPVPVFLFVGVVSSAPPCS
jgi:hypothetical protein